MSKTTEKKVTSVSVVTFVLCGVIAAASWVRASESSGSETLIGHPVRLDGQNKLLPWTDAESPYDRVMTLAWNAFKKVPVQANGLRSYYSYSMFDPHPANLFRGGGWVHHPAGLNSMLTQSALTWYAYSGDSEVIQLAREFLDHQLEHGTTPPDWAWSRVPYASSHPGSTRYEGADDRIFCYEHQPCGRGDGIGFIEPDKVGELGFAYLRFYEYSGERKYLEAAVSCADSLARNVRIGTRNKSPWPFRVDAKTGKNIREEYTSNVIFPIQLFDELIRIREGNTRAYAGARFLAWDWMMQFPIQNNLWQGYFEDIPIFKNPGENPNQYSALETARYLLSHPEMDRNWRVHVRSILDWVVKTFAKDEQVDQLFEPGTFHSAEVISEQGNDMAKMGSHTARYASILSLWHERTGDPIALEKAYRSYNWATYSCSDDGVVKVGPNDREGHWFSDGYADYMQHFLRGFASVPEWAPRDQNHLLRSGSVIQRVSYGEKVIEYSAFSPLGTSDSIDLLKLRDRPIQVLASGTILPELQSLLEDGYTIQKIAQGGFRLEIRHRASAPVQIRLP